MTQSSCLSILRAWMFFICLVLFATTIQLAHGQTATLSPTSRSFGSVAVGSSSGSTTVTLTNTGRAALSVSSITTSGDFTQTNTCGSSVAAARNCVITITFKPTAIGARTGTLTVNDGVGTQTASLTGTGITPITISPASRAFGSVVIGQTSAARTFTITNRETVALPITVASTNTEFAQTGCGSSLAAGASCTASVTFTPAATATGLQAGQIQVSYTGIGSPQSVSVQGTAVAPLTARPNPVQFSLVRAVGTPSVPHVVTITNNNQTSATAIQSIVSSPAAYAITGNTCGSSISAGLSCAVTIVFTPTVVGTTTGTLTITSGGIPLVVNMTGGAQVNNLVSLVITVPSPTLAAGSTEQLTATGTYANGTTGDVTAAAVWTSSNTGVLSFGTTPGLAKGVAGGTATVTATVSGTSS
ncbi:MAG: choice-of-anchor D domain-containing protein, partial [Terriglobales bacterium]